MKPILFNTEMVRAILEGRKTVTRRVVKFMQGKNPNWTGYVKDGLTLYNGTNEPCNIPAPYKVNDILYVRETWSWYYTRSMKKQYIYRATNENISGGQKWKPSLHMPKEAARIFLRVTDVRVERLKDITNEQILAEGVDKKQIENYLGQMPDPQDEWTRERYVFEWSYIWDKTIKKDQYHHYSWSANPYVWVIEFERITQEQAEGKAAAVL